MHGSTYEYLKPTDLQMEKMQRLRGSFLGMSQAIAEVLPEGPDKTYVLRKLRECAMWSNIAITRHPDGSPRSE